MKSKARKLREEQARMGVVEEPAASEEVAPVEAAQIEPAPEESLEVQVLEGALEIPVSLIDPNPKQPRTEFDITELEGLAQSIIHHGILQPLSVEGNGERYILIAGERRLRAAKLAGLSTVPAIVTPSLNGAGASERLVRALIENVQRADMNPIEEAKGYQALVEMGYSQTRIAQELGISYGRVEHALGLLKLESEIQDLIESRKLTKDSRLVKALQEIPDASARLEMAKKIVERRSTIVASVDACHKLAAHIKAEKLGKDLVPAMHLTERKTGPVHRPTWDALAQVGKVPPWPLLEIAVRDTCDNCELRSSAGPTICDGCALVECLVVMIGRAQNQPGARR